MKFIFTLIVFLIMPVFVYAEIIPRTVYAVTPVHISYENILQGDVIELYPLENTKEKNLDINIKSGEEINVRIVEYIEPKRGKQKGYYIVQYCYGTTKIDGKMRASTPKDFKSIAKSAGISIAGKILEVPGFSQAIALSKGLISPNENQSRLKSAGQNLYESTPLTYVEKGEHFDVNEDGVVVLKLKVKE